MALDPNTVYHIIPSDLFATPDDMEALNAYLNKFSGSEKLAAVTCAMMAWNLAARMLSHNAVVNEMQLQEEEMKEQEG